VTVWKKFVSLFASTADFFGKAKAGANIGEMGDSVKAILSGLIAPAIAFLSRLTGLEGLVDKLRCVFRKIRCKIEQLFKTLIQALWKKLENFFKKADGKGDLVPTHSGPNGQASLRVDRAEKIFVQYNSPTEQSVEDFLKNQSQECRDAVNPPLGKLRDLLKKQDQPVTPPTNSGSAKNCDCPKVKKDEPLPPMADDTSGLSDLEKAITAVLTAIEEKCATACAVGSCFVAGTVVQGGTPTVIEPLGVNHHVRTYIAAERPADLEDIDCHDQTLVSIRLNLQSETRIVDINLLRSPDWIEDYGAHVGGYVYLDMPEMGAEGLAEVLAIEPAPEIEPLPEGCDPSEYRLITGTFRHTSGEVYDLKLASETKPIGVTGTHPFWSISRGSWVSVLDLEIGETLKTLEGTTVVESRVRRPGSEPVYNIEVEGDHVYRVGESGVLVHNNSIDDCQFLPLTFNVSAGVVKGIKYFETETIPNGGGQRATRVQARINKGNLNGGTPAAYYPPGWIKNLNQQNQRAIIARGHLLAQVLGGSGSDPRNIVPICHRSTNSDMEHDIELPVRNLLRDGTCPVADYEVWVTYSDQQRPAVPDSVHVKAHVFDNGVCTKFSQIFPNKTNLNNCPSS